MFVAYNWTKIIVERKCREEKIREDLYEIPAEDNEEREAKKKKRRKATADCLIVCERNIAKSLCKLTV